MITSPARFKILARRFLPHRKAQGFSVHTLWAVYIVVFFVLLLLIGGAHYLLARTLGTPNSDSELSPPPARLIDVEALGNLVQMYERRRGPSSASGN